MSEKMHIQNIRSVPVTVRERDGMVVTIPAGESRECDVAPVLEPNDSLVFTWQHDMPKPESNG